jgi:signal transduction histidine kinase/ligand-binding sensor domain-containing protein
MTIYEDHEKVLWVGTASGLCTYDRNADQFVRYRFSSGHFNHLNFWGIHEDVAGALWFAVQGGGIVNMTRKRDRFVNFQYDANNSNSLNSNYVSSIFRDKSGIIWAGTYCEGINKLIPVRKKFEQFKNVPGDSASLSHNWVLSIFEDNEGVLWIGATRGGLNKFDRKKRTFTRYRFDSYWYDNIFNICQSKSGALWLARGRCLTEFNAHTEKFTNYYGKYLTYSAEVFSCIDSLIKRNKAIASIQQVGNNQSLAREFEMRRPANVLIVAAGEGNLSELFDHGWVDLEGTRDPFWKMEAHQARYAGGAFKNRLQVSMMTMKAGKYKLRYQSNSKHAYKAWTGMPPDNPELWGIFVFPIARNEIKAIKPLLTTEDYRNLWTADMAAVYDDRSGKLWCLRASRGDLHYFDPDAKQFIPHEIAGDGDISSDITVLFEDRSGDFWFGTFNNGLLRQVRGETGTEYIQYKRKNDDPGSISNNHITVIYEDQAGFLWIGTDDGLNKFDKNSETFIRYTQKGGLAFGQIMSILEDNKDNLWISTSKGLAKFNFTTGALKNFDETDGLPSNQYSSARCKSKDGQMFFGGTNGLVAFYPDSIQENLHKPQIALTDFQILNQSVVPGKDSPLKKAISEADEITLSYTQNMFSFKFAALDFTCPAKNQYAYKMEGFHDDWIHCGNERTALFMNLDPGKYVFKVKASNNDGVWNEEGTSIKVIIIPPFWQRLWFQLVLGLLVLGGIIGLVRFLSTRKLRQQLEAVEQQRAMEKERTRISSDMHDEVGASLTHIAITSELLKKSLHQTQKNEALDYVEDISRTAREVIDHIGEIIWAINPRNDSLDSVIAYIRQYAGNFFEVSPIRCHYDLPERLPPQTLTSEARRNLFLVTKEALNNILKHAEAEEVQIKMALHGDDLKLSIEDNGKGFCQQEVSRFGNGLKNMKKRMEDIGGQFEISSRPGEGTVIKIRLRLK